MPSGSTACPPVTTTCQPPTSKVSEPGGGAVPLGGGGVEGVDAGITPFVETRIPLPSLMLKNKCCNVEAVSNTTKSQTLSKQVIYNEYEKRAAPAGCRIESRDLYATIDQ